MRKWSRGLEGTAGQRELGLGVEGADAEARESEVLGERHARVTTVHLKRLEFYEINKD